TIVVPGHDRHVLQVALTALVADWTVVRVVHHQPLDDAGAEFVRVLVLDRDARAFFRRRHARHHDLAVRVMLVAELLDRALPTRPHRAHRRMPAEVRQVEAERQARVQQVLRRVDAIIAAVDVHRRRGHAAWPRNGHRRSRMWRKKSSRKSFTALCSGSTAPGASAQNVWPGPKSRDCCASSSRSDSWPWPASIAASVRA